MYREIEHILSENYPNPPPPGFRYPPLPRIIQLSENNIKTEYCLDHVLFETVINIENEEDEYHDATAFFISNGEPRELSPVGKESIKANAVSHNIENIIEELETKEFIKLEQDLNSIPKANKTEPIENYLIEIKNEKEVLKMKILENSLGIVNERNLNQVDQMSKHNFLAYPHSSPFGFYHISIPKIALYYNKEVDIENYNSSEQNYSEKEKIECNKNGTSMLELSNLDKFTKIEQNLKKLQVENEHRTIIINNEVINSQPKTGDKDLEMNKLSQKPETIACNEGIEKRIKTTICCCIKC